MRAVEVVYRPYSNANDPFGVRRFDAAFFCFSCLLSFLSEGVAQRMGSGAQGRQSQRGKKEEKEKKESGVKPPHSKEWHSIVELSRYPPRCLGNATSPGSSNAHGNRLHPFADLSVAQHT
jgi:hypothetical protein